MVSQIGELPLLKKSNKKILQLEPYFQRSKVFSWCCMRLCMRLHTKKTWKPYSGWIFPTTQQYIFSSFHTRMICSFIELSMCGRPSFLWPSYTLLGATLASSQLYIYVSKSPITLQPVISFSVFYFLILFRYTHIPGLVCLMTIPVLYLLFQEVVDNFIEDVLEVKNKILEIFKPSRRSYGRVLY